jgi:putative transposase
MLIQQAFKFELMPTGRQRRQMRRFAGACRFVFNEALRLQQATRAAGGKYLSYESLAKLLTAWRAGEPTPSGRQAPWLKEAPVHTLQHALKDLDRAYQNFFAKRARFPNFKKHGSGMSFRFPDAKQFTLDEANARIKLPKLGWVRYRKSRDVRGVPRAITLSCTGDRWFASVQAQRETAEPVHPALTGPVAAVGIDMGVVRFAALSDGTYLEPLASFQAHQVRLARYQRRMARKVKGSANWEKARRCVQRVHSRIANARKDFLHKSSTQIACAHARVIIEDLGVKAMSASARGSATEPGRRVRQKAGLNRLILDQGWAEFRRQLEYKLAWRGGELLAVPAAYTSQTCPACGHVSPDNRQSQAMFACVACGHTGNADWVAAVNILERGHRLTACGEDARRERPARAGRAASKKQEPTEVTMQEATHA